MIETGGGGISCAEEQTKDPQLLFDNKYSNVKTQFNMTLQMPAVLQASLCRHLVSNLERIIKLTFFKCGSTLKWSLTFRDK